MQILPQIKAQIFADCKTKRKKLRKQKRKNNRKIPLAPYSQNWEGPKAGLHQNCESLELAACNIYEASSEVKLPKGELHKLAKLVKI